MKWTFEPGHTAAHFKAKHMMVTWVRGRISPIKGKLVFDPNNPKKSSVEVTLDVKTLSTGVKMRDDHLKSKDFLDMKKYPNITFKGNKVKIISESEFQVTGDLTIRGIKKKTTLDVTYHGQWDTPWWVGKKNLGPKRRAGFTATTSINRHDFKVSWNDVVDKGGVVVGDTIHLTIDAEAVLD